MTQNELRDNEMKLFARHINTLQSITKERWKYIYINGEQTTYLCSNFGRIANTKTFNGKKGFSLLRPIRYPSGYYKVALSVKGKVFQKYIHRLVCDGFIDIPPKYKDIPLSKLECNHIDGTAKWNNTVFNLEWCTSSDNKLHGYKTKLYKSGENNHLASHSTRTVELICQLIEKNELSIPEIAKYTNTKEGFVYDILYKGSWKHVSDKYDFSKYTQKQQKYTNDQLSKMKIMLEKGIAPKIISDETGIKIKTVYFYRKKYK